MKLLGVQGRVPGKHFLVLCPFFGKALLSLLKGNFMAERPQVKKEIYKSNCISNRLAETKLQHKDT